MGEHGTSGVGRYGGNAIGYIIIRVGHFTGVQGLNWCSVTSLVLSDFPDALVQFTEVRNIVFLLNSNVNTDR